jgi:hypothetical protein
MLDAPEVYVEYKLGSMLSKRREFPVIRLNVAEVVYVMNAKGESNVKRITDVMPKSDGRRAVNHFGTLDLTVGKVVLMDYSKMIGGKPFTQEMTLNYRQKFHNVSDDELKRLVMLPGLKAFAGKIGDITPALLEKGVKGVVSTGVGTVTNVAGTVRRNLGSLFQAKTNAPVKK